MKSIVSKVAITMALALATSAQAMGHDGECHAELGTAMEDMKSAMRMTAFEMRQGNLEEARNQVAILIEKSEESKTYQPIKTREYEGEDKEAFLANYQEGMDQLLAYLTTMDTQLAEGDVDEAMKTFREIDQHSKRSHRSFKDDC
ncbi:cytochrome b562 [Salinibius halmophilus]|uniref:cytochrome b562 n=1 Tax=Salinibius halmophilus TaxID=1853216 RepID=UPI000E66C295|nr:cytochrome b562 [Salinibius halmophilus]